MAEEVIFGEDNVTTGASNDFMQVSRVARQMVERFGFSKKIGQIAIGGPGGNPFLGQQVCSNNVTQFTFNSLTDSTYSESFLTCRCHPRKITLWQLQILWMQRLESW